MTKQQREYTTARIRAIAKEKQLTCECDSPSRGTHIRRAIADGTAKVKSAKLILARAREMVLDGSSSYRGAFEMNTTDIFEAPESYHAACWMREAAIKKDEAKNKATMDYAKNLVDRVELGEFEDGKEAIRLMEAYQAKGAKPKA